VNIQDESEIAESSEDLEGENDEEIIFNPLAIRRFAKILSEFQNIRNIGVLM